MDPMLQRLGDVTIQRLDKPKDGKVGPQGDGNPLEKEKKAEMPPIIAPDSPTTSTAFIPAEDAIVSPEDIQSSKRNFEELAGPSTKRTKFDEDGKFLHDDISNHSFSDNDMSDYDSESEIESDIDLSMHNISLPKAKSPECEQDNTNSNFEEEESQEPNADFLENLVQDDFIDESAIKIEPVSKPDDDYDYDIKEKLKEMGEISFETVKKGDTKPKKPEVSENEVSVVPAKKGADEDSLSAERKGGMMRRNIREVMDETKLDESTLAAQRQEMERLRRVQEQQRLIRDVQRQMAQERVISLLQGSNLPKPGTSGGTKIGNTVLVKLPNGQTKPMTKLNKKPFDLMRVPKGAIPPHPKQARSMIPIKRPLPTTQANLTPSVSIAPVGKRPIMMSQPPSESDSDTEDSMHLKPICHQKPKEPVQTIDISSDDDCIVVSESENDLHSDEVEDPTNSGMHTNDEFNQPDEQGRVVINIGHPDDETDIYLAPQIARIIKPHQIGGIRFLYDNIIESTKRFETSTGFGCILAHSMGLGKTLQVVCFSDIFLRHTPARTILCIMPINTLQNWMAEYNMWLPTEDGSSLSSLLAHGEVRPRNFNLHVLNDSHKTLTARARVIHEWKSAGGVLLIGYEQYRLLSLRKYPRSRSKKAEQKMLDDKMLFDEIHEALVTPGPDLVICDEGHRIKNSHASISQALKQMETKRRVVLTGYPLQNNLMEYWCMVDFVRPNYLGTKTEFCNMFERPIQNGQCIDSTEADIKLMRYRAHVLHSLLVGFVQRRSHRVLQTALPQKEEYVLLVRMTTFQRTLYETFMNEVVRTQTVPNPLKAFAVCCKIWNHPDVLYHFLKKQAKGEAVDIDLEEVSNAVSTSEDPTKPKSSPKKASRAKKPAASVTPYNTNANVESQQQNQQQTSQQQNQTSPNVPSSQNSQNPGNNFPKPPQISPLCTMTSSNLNPTSTHSNSNPPTSFHEHQNFSQQNFSNSNPGFSNNVQNFGGSGQSNFQKSNYSNVPNELANFGNSQNSFSSNSQTQGFNNIQNQNFSTNTNQSFNSMQNPNYSNSTNNFMGSNTPNFTNQNQQGFTNNSQGQNFPSQSSTFTNNSNMIGQQPNSNNQLVPAQPQNQQFRNNQNFSNNSQVQNYSQQSPNYCSPPNTQQQQQNFNYQNQNYWNPGQDVKPPADDSYFNNFSQQYNQNQMFLNNQWIKKEDVKPSIGNMLMGIKTENDIKPKINIISDIKFTNVYDSLGNISPEKKINILRDIKLEPKKEEPDFREDVKQEFMPDGKIEPKCEPKSENDDVKTMNEVPPLAKSTPTPVPPKEDTGIPYDWAKELLKDYLPGFIENSAKMAILFCIIKESLGLGDRLLVFSQSLITLDLIEQFLQSNIVPGDTQRWAKNTNYYRLDGSTSALEREKLINEFNSNPKVYLFLVSTRAGSLGINLIGANRVVVLDASWNPCHDTQAVCRVYRYGQRKPCFVYRFVVDNCLEKKIYDRQINKQGMSDRVVDECNPDAHLTMKDVSTLCWDDEQETEEQDWSFTKDNYIDVVLQKVLEQHGTRFNKEPFQHESLLIDRKDKQLSRQEKRMAKKGYEREKQAANKPSYGLAGNPRGHRPVASVRPMQQGGERPTRWIPAEHWQRQGMTAQEMTLPLDVVIPTNQPDKGNIVLKAGQKVLVLKSPKGVYMQLESGKIVAIKTAIKVRGKAEEDANKVKASLPLAIKNNAAISVMPQKRSVKPCAPGLGKFNLRSVKQAVPNLVSQIQKVGKKMQMGKTRPYQIGAEIVKAVRSSSDIESHPVSSSEDERSSDKRFQFRGEGHISLLKPHTSRSESDEGDIQRSEDDSMGSSKDDISTQMPQNYKHFNKQSLAKSNSSSALQQLEQSTSAIMSESKQPFQETLDSITSSYQDDKSDESMSHKESTVVQVQPIQIEDDSPGESEEQYETTPSQPSSSQEPTIKTDIPTPEYGYNNYYNYNHMQPYPPPPPQGYPGYPPPQPPPYDMNMYPPQQQQPPYNYGAYPQGYPPPQPQYPPPQPYEYGPPPPQPIYSGYPPYPPQQYPPPPPQGAYPPPPAPAAPYPEYQYPAAPPPVASTYYPPQT